MDSASREPSHTATEATRKRAATTRYLKRLALSFVGGVGLFELALALSEVVTRHADHAIWMTLLGVALLRVRDLEMRVEDLMDERRVAWSALLAHVVASFPKAERAAAYRRLEAETLRMRRDGVFAPGGSGEAVAAQVAGDKSRDAT